MLAGEIPYAPDRHGERFLLRGHAHRHCPVWHIVQETRILRRVLHRHCHVHVDYRVRRGLHQRHKTGTDDGLQRTDVIAGLQASRGASNQGFLQARLRQGGHRGDIQKGPAQQENQNCFAHGRRVRRYWPSARFVNARRRSIDSRSHPCRIESYVFHNSTFVTTLHFFISNFFLALMRS